MFALVSMNLPFPHPKLEKWEKNGSKVKISTKLGILKAAQNKKDFTFNGGGFSYVIQIPFFWVLKDLVQSVLQLFYLLYLFQSWTLLVKLQLRINWKKPIFLPVCLCI